MVQLEEVEDEEFLEKPFEDEDFTDTDSSISDDEDTSHPESESLAERISALRDIVPPATRRRITSGTDKATSYVKSGVWFGLKGMWVVSTGLLLIAVPFALALVEEQQIMEMEKEQKMREMGNELITPGAIPSNEQQEAKASL